MAEFGVTRLPVVDPDDSKRVVSLITLRDLLQARSRAQREEREGERMLRGPTLVGRAQRQPRPSPGTSAS
jgi:CBS domain-containing protein